MTNRLQSAIIVTVFFVAYMVAGRASAQSPMTPHRVAADTGRMTWGHADYTRYTTAGACDRAVQHVAREIWPGGMLDTLPYTMEHDTLPTAAVLTARSCGARFTAAAASPLDLWSVMRISLARGDDAEAAAAIDRLFAAAPDDSVRSHVLRTGVLNYLTANAPRLVPAQRLMRQLDTLPSALRVERYEAHLLMLRYWQTSYDADSMRAHANTAIALLAAMTRDEQDMVDVFFPYFTLISLANNEQDAAAQLALVDQALKDVGPWRDGKGTEQFLKAEHLVGVRTSVYGKKTRSLTGKFWFNDGGRPHPTPGKLSLIVHFNHLCGVRCYPLYTMVRGLRAKYGDAIDITLITDIRGHAVTTGVTDPESEAKAIAAYYLDYLKLPVTLLVDQGPFTKRRDGHVEYKPSPTGDMFDGWELVNTVLIDPAGKIQWLDQVSSSRDRRMVESVIDRALHRAASAAQTQ